MDGLKCRASISNNKIPKQDLDLMSLFGIELSAFEFVRSIQPSLMNLVLFALSVSMEKQPASDNQRQ